MFQVILNQPGLCDTLYQEKEKEKGNTLHFCILYLSYFSITVIKHCNQSSLLESLSRPMFPED